MHMIKPLTILLGLLLAALLCPAQVLQPASWRYYTSGEVVRQGQEIDLYLEARLDRGWQLYSSDADPDLGPVPAAFSFDPDPGYALVGEVRPIGALRTFDSLWQGEVRYFEGKALFRQRIRILGKRPRIGGTHTYQLCSKQDGRCILGEEDFRITGLEVVAVETQQQQQGRHSGTQVPEPPQKGSGIRPAGAEALEQNGIPRAEPGEGHAAPLQADGPAPGLDLDPKGRAQQGKAQAYTAPPGAPQPGVPQQASEAPSGAVPGDLAPLEQQGVGKDSVESGRGMALWRFALLAFGAGLAALLTPCVFPIIPLTVTYFTFPGKRENALSPRQRRVASVRKALLFGGSIILIYTLAGTFLAWLNGPAFANFISTHWLPNLLFFGVFMLFALSFLGLFDIRLPAILLNRVDRQAERGGFLGLFFMAFTLTLVSFSCTGPLVGTLLVASAGGAVLLPLVGMASFALAIALPFTLLALFPHWLKQLPHSGSWLNSVKVVLGFLELALGLKFLSVADQVYGLGILDREVYLALWIVIFSAMGLYLLGKLRLGGDGPSARGAGESLGVPRLLLALGTFTFVVYLLPGMVGAPLSPLAGYLPPLNGEGYTNAGLPGAVPLPAQTGEGLCEEPLWGDRLHWPHGLEGYFEREQALACAREQGKPLFVAFTGHGCVNCREMEARVWSNPEVLQRLRRDFVLLALYVDERRELPQAQWYRSDFDGRIKKSVGMQNADYQIRRFGNNAQPYYVILDPQSGALLQEPMAYDLEVSTFLAFLDRGLAAYRALPGSEALQGQAAPQGLPGSPGSIL